MRAAPPRHSHSNCAQCLPYFPTSLSPIGSVREMERTLKDITMCRQALGAEQGRDCDTGVYAPLQTRLRRSTKRTPSVGQHSTCSLDLYGSVPGHSKLIIKTVEVMYPPSRNRALLPILSRTLYNFYYTHS